MFFVVIDLKMNNDFQDFIIRNDAYISSYLNSLSNIGDAPSIFMENLLAVKFEELISSQSDQLELTDKVGPVLIKYLMPVELGIVSV